MTKRAESVIANNRAESVIAKIDTFMYYSFFNKVYEISHILSFYRLQEI